MQRDLLFLFCVCVLHRYLSVLATYLLNRARRVKDDSRILFKFYAGLLRIYDYTLWKPHKFNSKERKRPEKSKFCVISLLTLKSSQLKINFTRKLLQDLPQPQFKLIQVPFLKSEFKKIKKKTLGRPDLHKHLFNVFQKNLFSLILHNPK